MTKELESLIRIAEAQGDLEISKDTIGNNSYSEALECLEKIVDKTRINDGSCCHWRECLNKNKCNFNNDNLMCPDYTRANTIKQYILKAQEQEKVLKILFEKQVDIWYLKECFEDEYGREKYNNRIGYEYSLTQEEFDSVKRWAECQKN